MSSQIVPITLTDLQRPVRGRLDRVPHEVHHRRGDDLLLRMQTASHFDFAAVAE